MTLLWHYYEIHYNIHYDTGDHYDTINTLLSQHYDTIITLLSHYYHTIMNIFWLYYHTIMTVLSLYYNTYDFIIHIMTEYMHPISRNVQTAVFYLNTGKL